MNIEKQYQEMFPDTKLDIKKLLEPYKKQIQYMTETKGEPILIPFKDDLYLVDGSVETPDRRSLCYNREARINRKKYPPVSSVLEECEKHNVSLMDEELYRYLQTIRPVDLKTSSWIKTPDSVLTLGGALFCDNRYNKVFTYHNGSDSYYGSRGFRVFIKLTK